jgi:hypothetical protein
MRVPVTQGRRYAAGVKIPLLAGLIPGSPLSALRELAESEGMATLEKPEHVALLSDLGWANVVAYKRGRAPITEPASDHELVFIATRSGTGSEIDTDDPQWGGALRWVEETTTMPGQAPKPGGVDGAKDTPWALYGIAAGLLTAIAVGVVVVVTTEP